MEIVHRDVVTTVGSSMRVLPNGGNPGDRDTFHVSFDPPAEDVVEVVVNAVATIRNVEPHELAPLQEAIDVDSLDRLVDPDETEQPADLEVAFLYQGLDITVTGDGDVWLEWQ